MNKVLEADRALFLLIHGRLRRAAFDPIMVWFTRAGTKGILWLGIAAGLLIEPNRHARTAAVMSVAALLLAEGVINIILKPAIARKRPYERPGLSVLLVHAPGPHSWPSAHAGSSVAASVVLAFAYAPLSVVFLGLALLIAYSRIYVGVHYPLDVGAGAVIGGIAAAAVILCHGTVAHLLP